MILLSASLALAEEVCVTLDISGFTQHQKNMVKAFVYSLGYEASGQDVIPTVSCNDCNSTKVCFKDPTFDVATIITGQKILDRYAVEKAKSDAETARLQVLETELNTINDGMKTDDTNWTSMTTTQKLVAIKKLLRREVLKRELGQ